MKRVQPVFIREEMIRHIRSFFVKRRFHEGVIPVLNPAVPLEPTIVPFSTRWSTIDGDKTLYLSTSPERHLKRVLASGVDRCFAIGHAFRNLEQSGPYHRPEFLMLEWYRKHTKLEAVMKDLEALARSLFPAPSYRYQGHEFSCHAPFVRLSLEHLFVRYVGVSFSDILTEEAMRDCAKRRGYTTSNATWEQLFNQIMMQEIESRFPKRPFFLTEFPARISPLCRQNAEKPYLADRFECCIAGIEVANGNVEETDRARVRRTFDEERVQRTTKNLPSSPIDDQFLQSLDLLSGDSCAGVGLGIDRLAMILADVVDIHAFDVYARTSR